MAEFSWRDEFTSQIEYKRKFAFLPVRCADTDKRVWCKPYYTKYKIWGYPVVGSGHREVVSHVTEDEYIVRILSNRM